jgi:hypothetical protein
MCAPKTFTCTEPPQKTLQAVKYYSSKITHVGANNNWTTLTKAIYIMKQGYEYGNVMWNLECAHSIAGW